MDSLPFAEYNSEEIPNAVNDRIYKKCAYPGCTRARMCCLCDNKFIKHNKCNYNQLNGNRPTTCNKHRCFNIICPDRCCEPRTRYGKHCNRHAIDDESMMAFALHGYGTSIPGDLVKKIFRYTLGLRNSYCLGWTKQICNTTLSSDIIISPTHVGMYVKTIQVGIYYIKIQGVYSETNELVSVMYPENKYIIKCPPFEYDTPKSCTINVYITEE